VIRDSHLSVRHDGVVARVVLGDAPYSARQRLGLPGLRRGDRAIRWPDVDRTSSPTAAIHQHGGRLHSPGTEDSAARLCFRFTGKW
jgi:hypothetical protein